MADKRTQREKFEEAARQVECDTDKEALDSTVEVIWKSSPKPQEGIKAGRKSS